jgi:hypothetical protein
VPLDLAVPEVLQNTMRHAHRVYCTGSPGSRGRASPHLGRVDGDCLLPADFAAEFLAAELVAASLEADLLEVVLLASEAFGVPDLGDTELSVPAGGCHLHILQIALQPACQGRRQLSVRT